MTPEERRAIMVRDLGGQGEQDRNGRRVSCFVALGDSFTAGTGCADGERWADRVASKLRIRNPRLTYSNLASEGATSEVVLEQVGAAIQLEPDLVSVICGANDVLRRVRPDVEGYASRLSEILDRLRGALPEVALVTATSPEGWRFLELPPRTRARVVSGLERVNEVTRTISAERGVPCFDVVDHPGLADAENFGPDGLHPSAAGHERAAYEMVRLLHDEFGIVSDGYRG